VPFASDTQGKKPPLQLFCGEMGVYGVEGAERVDEGGASVHSHGYAEGFGDFFAGGAGFEGVVGVDGDAAVAVGGDGDGEGDEFADFGAEFGVFGVGGGEGLVATNGIGSEFHELGELGADLFLVFVPVEHHGKPPEKSWMVERREYTTGGER
jgi:hypothetical protein